MTKLDTRFLTVHPRTALWWEQRKQCEQCRNVVVKEVKGGGQSSVTVRCAKYPSQSAGVSGIAYAIDARDTNGPCGPDAKLFQPKE